MKSLYKNGEDNYTALNRLEKLVKRTEKFVGNVKEYNNEEAEYISQEDVNKLNTALDSLAESNQNWKSITAKRRKDLAAGGQLKTKTRKKAKNPLQDAVSDFVSTIATKGLITNEVDSKKLQKIIIATVGGAISLEVIENFIDNQLEHSGK